MKPLWAILRPAPYAQNLYTVEGVKFINHDVGRHGDKLAGAGDASNSAPTRKDGQAVARKDKFAGDFPGGNGVFLGDIGQGGQHRRGPMLAI